MNTHLVPGKPTYSHERVDPTRPFQQEIVDTITAHYGGADKVPVYLKVLDVGAGPATTLGKIWPGHVLQTRACDADAYRYATVWKKIERQPLIATEFCRFEEVHKDLEGSSFDVIFQMNAVDHAYNLPRAIQSMLQLLKPGGLMIWFNMRNEGLRQNYWALHQWDLDKDGDDFVIRGPGPKAKTFKVNQFLAQMVDIKIQRVDHPWMGCPPTNQQAKDHADDGCLWIQFRKK